MLFEKLYEQYSEVIYQYIYFLVGQETIAEDLMQETFIFIQQWVMNAESTCE